MKNFITEGILEVVQNYDIDAVHMDDYFYPYKVTGEEFPDQNTYETYNNGKFSNIGNWRRDNVNQLVSGLNTAIKQEKSYVKFGISPFGVWRNIADDPTGSNTTAGQRNYDDLYADTREWIQKGYIDYITPKIYWNIGFTPAAYDVLLDWWVKETENKPIHLYIGQAAYKINNNSVPAWSDPEEYPRQITLNHQFSQIKGSMHFSLKDINNNPLGIKDRLQKDIYKHPALIPPMPWLDQDPPKQPTLKGAIARNDGIALGIIDNRNNDSTYYAIYRVDDKNDVDIQKAENLLTTVRKTKPGEIYVDKTAVSGETYTYAVTALDRLHNESIPSSKTTIIAK